MAANAVKLHTVVHHTFEVWQVVYGLPLLLLLLLTALLPYLGHPPLHDEEVRVVHVQLHRLEQVRHPPATQHMQPSALGESAVNGTG
jgi:hypothetical protein